MSALGLRQIEVTVRLPGISPPLEPTEALELGMIQSVAGGPTP
jgi:predicted ATPase with chaperone activity